MRRLTGTARKRWEDRTLAEARVRAGSIMRGFSPASDAAAKGTVVVVPWGYYFTNAGWPAATLLAAAVDLVGEVGGEPS